MIKRWNAWIAAFDECVADDQWDRLKAFLTDDVVYAVTGIPMACEIRGRDAVIAGFARSIRNFDHKLGGREWYGVGIRFHAPNAITAQAMVVYRPAGMPVISFAAHGFWMFRGGQICMMTDVYDAEEIDAQVALALLEQSGGALDPSYV
jgi:predicted ester cyclase